MTLAQRFNVGSDVTTAVSPKGTADLLATGSAVPSGLIAHKNGSPNVETLGYFQIVPSGEGF